MKKKVGSLIINPSALKSIYQSLSSGLAALEPPIWAGLIANYLRNKHYRTAIIDCEGELLTDKDLISRIKQYDFKLIVVVVYGQQPSASTQNMSGASRVCTLIKQIFPYCKIAIIGGHVSALPEKTLEEEDIDFVCIGEGPLTVEGLLLANWNDFTQMKKIPGLLFMYEGQKVKTPPASLIRDLDRNLPGVAYDLLPMKNYRAHNWHCFDDINNRSPYVSLYTSLGCPFKCAFCCINAPFGGSFFRHWSVEFILKQFKYFSEQGIRNVKIADEMFVLKEQHFLSVCKQLAAFGYDFNIWAYARVDTIRFDHLETMRKAGIKWICLGIESKSTYVRDGVAKGDFKKMK